MPSLALWISDIVITASEEIAGADSERCLDFRAVTGIQKSLRLITSYQRLLIALKLLLMLDEVEDLFGCSDQLTFVGLTLILQKILVLVRQMQMNKLL